MSIRDDFTSDLAALRDARQERSLRAWPGAGGIIANNGRRVLNLSSNDYLDLANNPRLKRAAQAAVERWGCGATASRLMAGNLELHEELERRLADLTGQEAALAFPSGYQTNLAILSTMAGPDSVIFSDELNHASIIDGCRLSGARVEVYRHGDVEHLEELSRGHPSVGRRIIVSDAVFSMDGDLAPVRELHALARRYGALLIVDEAHALGVFGQGAGLCREAGITPDLTIGTMSKALGGAGGFAACSDALRAYLINKARPFIFSTGLAPAPAGSASEAVDIIEQNPGLGAALLVRANALRELLRERGIEVPDDRSQIIPLVVGSNEAALDAATALHERGVLAVAVRPPSVAEGSARLRLSVTLAHSPADLRYIADMIAEVLAPAKV